MSKYQVVMETDYEIEDEPFNVFAPNHIIAVAKVDKKYPVYPDLHIYNEEYGTIRKVFTRKLSDEELNDKDKVYSLKTRLTETVSAVIEADSEEEAERIAKEWLDENYEDKFEENSSKVLDYICVNTGIQWKIDTDKPEMSTEGYVDGDNGSGFPISFDKKEE